MARGNLGFGLMRLPQKSDNPTDIDIDTLKKMVDLFIERGFTYFDTSYVYHNGESERAINKALVQRHDRNTYTLASKLPAFSITEEEQVEKTFNEQLSKCGVEYFDYYLLHNLNRSLYDTYVKSCKMFEHMKKWKEEGKIKHLGFSFHDSADVLDKILTEHPETDFVQIVVNYYDWEEGFIQSKKCYETIRKHGKEVVIMEPVKGGTLAKVPDAVLTKMKELNKNLTPASYAIRFSASLDGVIAVLSGMSTLEQVEDNTSYMQDFKPLTEKEKELLKFAKTEYEKEWKFRCSDWEKLDSNTPNKVPVSNIIRAYNSLMIQPDPYFGAELNYYKTFKLGYKLGIENEDYSECTKALNGELDVNQAVKESVEFFNKNGF